MLLICFESLRCTLLIGPKGDQLRLDNVPHVVKAQVLINQLIRQPGHQRGADVPDLEKRLQGSAAEKPET